ncbi:caspase, EACC1-associated type [Acaryochloris marina]|uniref:GUN4-like family protein n=1 Tax=Acaryochloris marina (strain MBIC 11017) TaxID=329726 RepID=B0C936_ACAM1|nr:GUN4 domain-containing protein [Acaryochloris marina]ABW26571.1 GUN4-like family protein [Acaryochloris marina MBIC11017]
MSESKKSALLIGVSEYGEGLNALSAPPMDVVAMKQVLGNSDLGGFSSANIKVLINPDLAEMRENIEDLFTRSSKQDLVLLYFSGHGITDDNNRLYLTSRNTSKIRYRSRSVPASFIQNLSDDTHAKRQVIILDCCYSGAFAEGWQRKGNAKVELERELGKEGRVVLTSSSSTQVSFQQEDAELSLYTQYLIEGIEVGAADEDQDGIVTVRELHNYAKKKVQAVKPNMKPDIIVANDEGYDIFLSKVKIDAESKFRTLVENYINHELGEIHSHRSQEILDKHARVLGLAVGHSQAIIASVLEPTRRRLKNLERYRQEYEAEVQKHYPLSEATLTEMKDWQQEILGLADGDVAKIQNEVNSAKESQIAKPKQDLELRRAKAEHQHQAIEQQEEQLKRERPETEAQFQQKEPELEQQMALEQQKQTMSGLEENGQDDLSSERFRGKYLAKLRDLLVAKDWKAADQETAERMKEVMGETLDEKIIRRFPCRDLLNIDRLWMKYSGGKFGFTVQHAIWESCNKDWNKFGTTVNWRDPNSWPKTLSWYIESKYTFSNKAVKGHLPTMRAFFVFGFAIKLQSVGECELEFAALMSRVKDCSK